MLRHCLVATLSLTLLSCDAQRAIVVTFAPSLDSKPLSCADPGPIRDFKAFLSEVALRDTVGRWHDLALDGDAPWQTAAVALLSASDCDAAAMNLTVRGTSTVTQIKGLRFTLGVPASLNHQDPTRAESPLNLASMFWTWQQGYKFLRLDGTGQTGGWALHLGSTGCASPAAVRPPEQPCKAANRVNVVLNDYRGTGDVVIALDRLVKALTDPTPASCTGSYAESEACTATLALLGLDASSGQCEVLPCAQQIFRLSGGTP